MNKLLKSTSVLILGTMMLTGIASAKPTSKNVKINLTSYKVNTKLSVPQLKLNNIIADYKYIDVTGDLVKDHVILSGNKLSRAGIYYDNLNIVVQNGKTKKFTKFSLGKDSGGYQPNLIFADINGDKVQDIITQMPTGGSGGIINYSIVTFKGDTPKTLINDNKFYNGVNADVKFLPNFKVELSIKEAKKTEILDLSGRKQMYIESEVYDEKGNLKYDVEGWTDPYSNLKLVDCDKNGTYELQMSQSISGTCHVDRLGNLITTWKWDGKSLTYNQDDIKLELIFDSKEEDINGDGTKDYISLSGSKVFGENSPYVRDIKLEVYDMKTGYKELPIGNVNEGYEPNMFIADFNGDKSQDILISIANGGSAGTSTYSLISYKDNKIVSLFEQEKFNYGLDYDVFFKDGFKAEIFIKNINRTFTIDLKDNMDFYIKDGIYDKDGKILKQTYGMWNAVSQVEPIDVDKDGRLELVVYQRVIGTSNAETLGYVKSVWKIQDKGIKLFDVTVEKI